MGVILRVSVLGTFPSGEVWSVNPCFEINGSGGENVTPAMAKTIADNTSVVSPNAGLLLAMAANTQLIGTRVESRALDGTLESQAETIRSSGIQGTGNAIHPPQTAIVVSLRTPGIGASARGRLYWPMTGQVLDATNGRLSSANQLTILAGLKQYLLGLETAVKITLPNANLTVWSRTTNNFHDVNALRLGNVVDTQRRRRDALIEAYEGTTYPS